MKKEYATGFNDGVEFERERLKKPPKKAIKALSDRDLAMETLRIALDSFDEDHESNRLK